MLTVIGVRPPPTSRVKQRRFGADAAARSPHPHPPHGGRRPASAGRRSATSAPLVVGYATGGRELLVAHRLHACCDLVLELRAVAGRACFAYLPAGGAVEQARITTREADVLVLVLGGLSTAALAERLCVSPATARNSRTRSQQA